MKHLTSLGQRLQQIYGGGNWLDEDFNKKLNTLSEDEAFTQPVPGVHSVAEIVWHCIYWRQTLIKRMEGDQDYRDRTVSEQNFLALEILKQKGWSTLRRELAESQHAILQNFQTLDDEFLRIKYDGTNDYEHLINGIIEHDAYHLGQIGLVIKILTVQRGVQSRASN